jgi:hypothetical protein
MIFQPAAHHDWMQTHASVPVPHQLDSHNLRIYFGTRDAGGTSRIGYVDVDPGDPALVRQISRRPVLAIGDPGTFDEHGVAPSSIVATDGTCYLYYIGWSRQASVPYRLAIGLAVGNDHDFNKHSAGPLWDRTVDEPYFCTAPFVLRDAGIWRMWYASCTGWQRIAHRYEPRYRIAYAESSDGVEWRRPGIVCIDYSELAQAIGRPCVIKQDNGYAMWYSYRSVTGYRTDPSRSYRLGYAVSGDGLSWTRRDPDVGIDRSDSGWDSRMIEYCYVYEHRGQVVMLYNGNGFGATGFGYAVLDQS